MVSPKRRDIISMFSFSKSLLTENVMVDFKPGEYMRNMVFFQSMTQTARKKISDYLQQEPNL